MLAPKSFGATQVLELAGARFTLAPIPDSDWLLIIRRHLAQTRAATRRALLALKAAGVEPTPEEVAGELDADAVFEADTLRHRAEVVAWGVAGHEGLVDAAGVAVPFQPQARPRLLAGEHCSASDATVAAYASSLGLLYALYGAVLGMNSLDLASKKNSPPPPASTTGGSAATTA